MLWQKDATKAHCQHEKVEWTTLPMESLETEFWRVWKIRTDWGKETNIPEYEAERGDIEEYLVMVT